MSVNDAIRIETSDDAPKIASNFCRHIFDEYEIKTQEYDGRSQCLVEVYPFSIDFKPSYPAIVTWAEHYIDGFGFIPNYTMPIFYSRSAQNWIQINGGYDIPPLRNVVLKGVLGLIKATDYNLILKLDEPEREVLIRHDGKLTLLDDTFWTEERLRQFADIPYESGKLVPWPGGDRLYIGSTDDHETVTKRFCEQAFEDFRIHSYRQPGANTSATKAISNDIEVNAVEYGQKYRQCHNSHRQNLGFVPNILMTINYGKDKTLDDNSPQRDATIRGAIGLIMTTDYSLALPSDLGTSVALLYRPGSLPRVAEEYWSDERLRLFGDMLFIANDAVRLRYYPE